MVEFLLLIAMLIYRSAMCCENSHHFKHLHFGDVGQARFEDIHRKNLTFGVTFPSPSRKKNEVPSFSSKFLFLLQTWTPPKWPPFVKAGCCFLGPLTALSVHPTWGQFIQKQPKKKSIGLQPSSNVSILENTKHHPKLMISLFFSCEAIAFSKSRLDLYLDPAGHPFIPGGAHFYCK